MKTLLMLFLLNTSFSYAEEAGPSYNFNLQDKPKKKVIKKVTTYEEVDDETAAATKKGVRNGHDGPSDNDSPYSAGANAHLDLLAGMATPMGKHVKDLKSRLGYGVQFLFDVTNEFAIGAYYSANEGSVKGLESVDVGFTYYGIVTQFRVSPIVYTQLKAGFSTLSISGRRTTLSASDNPFTASWGMGIELPINSVASFAPYASYTYSFDTDSTEPHGMLDVMAAVRFKF